MYPKVFNCGLLLKVSPCLNHPRGVRKEVLGQFYTYRIIHNSKNLKELYYVSQIILEIFPSMKTLLWATERECSGFGNYFSLEGPTSRYLTMLDCYLIRTQSTDSPPRTRHKWVVAMREHRYSHKDIPCF